MPSPAVRVLPNVRAVSHTCAFLQARLVHNKLRVIVGPVFELVLIGIYRAVGVIGVRDSGLAVFGYHESVDAGVVVLVFVGCVGMKVRLEQHRLIVLPTCWWPGADLSTMLWPGKKNVSGQADFKERLVLQEQDVEISHSGNASSRRKGSGGGTFKSGKGARNGMLMRRERSISLTLGQRKTFLFWRLKRLCGSDAILLRARGLAYNFLQMEV